MYGNIVVEINYQNEFAKTISCEDWTGQYFLFVFCFLYVCVCVCVYVWVSDKKYIYIHTNIHNISEKIIKSVQCISKTRNCFTNSESSTAENADAWLISWQSIGAHQSSWFIIQSYKINEKKFKFQRHSIRSCPRLLTRTNKYHFSWHQGVVRSTKGSRFSFGCRHFE